MIRRPDEVQVYESTLAGADGAPTCRLLRAAGHAKDNRPLPRGWDAAHPRSDRIRPVGTGDDSDFSAGGDTTTYQVELPPNAGPLVNDVSLLYQTLEARHAAELFEHDTPEARLFRAWYLATTRESEEVGAPVRLLAP